ncbi:hypothetical protein IWX91DRAFT_81411 [Phyllosticta citricarpa]
MPATNSTSREQHLWYAFPASRQTSKFVGPAAIASSRSHAAPVVLSDSQSVSQSNLETDFAQRKTVRRSLRCRPTDAPRFFECPAASLRHCVTASPHGATHARQGRYVPLLLFVLLLTAATTTTVVGPHHPDAVCSRVSAPKYALHGPRVHKRALFTLPSSQAIQKTKAAAKVVLYLRLPTC